MIETFEELVSYVRCNRAYRLYDFTYPLDIECHFMRSEIFPDNTYEDTFYFPKFDRYLSITFWDNNYDSDYLTCHEVLPVQKIVIDYEPIDK